MKKLILVASLALSLGSHAQTEQGRILLGGSVGFSSGKNEQVDTAGKVLNTSKVNSLGLTLRGGYFIADNVAVGLLVGFNTDKNKQETPGTAPSKSTGEQTNNSTSLGLFGRMYTSPVDRKFALFGQLDLAYTMGKRTDEDVFVSSSGVSTSTKTRGERNSFGVMISPGVAFFLSDHIALEATFGAIGFSSGKDKSYDTKDRLSSQTNFNNLEATISPSTLRLGITFFIGGGSSASTK
jgi:outer membrane protein W